MSVTNQKCTSCSKHVQFGEKTHTIYDNSSSDYDIEQLLLECIGKKVSRSSGLDQVICNGCLTNLINIQEFRKKCTEGVDEEDTDENDFIVEYLEESSDNENCDESIDHEGEIEYLLSESDTYLIEENNLGLEFAVESLGTHEILNVFNCCFCEDSEAEMPRDHAGLITHAHDVHRRRSDEHELIYPCPVERGCNIFKTAKELSDHILLKHYGIQLEPHSNRIKCLTCDGFFESKIELAKHMCTTDNVDLNRELSCRSCSAHFISTNRFRFHHQFHLENARPMICHVCGHKCPTETDFYNHVMFSHESTQENFFCNVCDQIFTTKGAAVRHSKSHLGERNFECPKCEKSFLDRQTLNEHSVMHLVVKPFRCDICGKTLNRASRLRKHIESHNKPKPDFVAVCEVCDTAYETEEAAVEHFEKQHLTTSIDGSFDNTIQYCVLDLVYCCEYCEVAFKTQQALLDHRSIHRDKASPFECGFCSARYDSFARLKTHRGSHNRSGTFPVQRHYLCEDENCLKSYLHWPDLSHHKKVVHNSRDSLTVCKLCGTKFKSAWQLAYHKKITHSNPSINSSKCLMRDSNLDGKEPLPVKTKSIKNHSMAGTSRSNHNETFKCDVCSVELSSLQTLRHHKKSVHEGLINYFCDFCGKGFYRLYDKRNHERIHTHEKPFDCPSCPYSCRTASMLKMHLRTHTTDRNFVCPYPGCNAAFKRPFSLKNHTKIHNKVNKE